MSEKCAFHDDKEATEKCSTCGKGLCDDCALTIKGKTYCPDCAKEAISGMYGTKDRQKSATTTIAPQPKVQVVEKPKEKSPSIGMNCTKHGETGAAGICMYCGKPFCKDCLVELDGKMYCRDDIGKVVSEAKREAESHAAPVQQPIIINNSNNNVNTNTNIHSAGGYYRNKSKIVALLLCIFLGYFGAHKFYEGKSGMGLLYFFTVGLFGIGWVIDILLILIGVEKDKMGQPLV